MNNTIDLTMYRIIRHEGLDKIRELLQKGVKTVLEPEYCECEQPDFEQDDELNWNCTNCEKPAKDYEPGEFESEIL